MKGTGALRFVILSGAIAAAVGLALLFLVPDRGPGDLFWGSLGWAIMATSGVAGGGWMVRRHGSAGSGFLVALGTCMLARLFASVAGALAAASSGNHAVWAFLAGLCAGYVPLQVFEVGWFIRKSRNRSRDLRSETIAPETAGEVSAGR